MATGFRQVAMHVIIFKYTKYILFEIKLNFRHLILDIRQTHGLQLKLSLFPFHKLGKHEKSCEQYDGETETKT